MQHEYSPLTQWIFSIVFSLFAVLGPVIGVAYSDSFGIRAIKFGKESDTNVQFRSSHSEFFCSGWAGECTERDIIRKVAILIETDTKSLNK